MTPVGQPEGGWVEAALDAIEAADHGENCFLGRPGEFGYDCYCGKDGYAAGLRDLLEGTTREKATSVPSLPDGDDPMRLRGSCEDPRLVQAGYTVCGSNGDREWHWKPPSGPWRDHYRSEEAAVKAALRHLDSTPTDGAGQGAASSYHADAVPSETQPSKKAPDHG